MPSWRLFVLNLWWAAASSASNEVGDGLALAQRSYRVSPGVLEAGLSAPAGAQTAPPKAKHIQNAWDILRLLPKALNATTRPNLVRNKDVPDDAEDVEDDDEDNWNLQEMMGFLNNLTTAVRSPVFMNNMTLLFKTMMASSKDYMHKGMAAVDKFAFASRTAQDKEMPALVFWLLNNMTNSTIAFGNANMKAMNIAAAAIPTDMLELIEKTATPIQDLLNQPILSMANATATGVCEVANARFQNTSGALVTLHKAANLINNSKMMLPMMDAFLNSTRPQVAERIHNLVVNFLDTSGDITSDGIALWENVVSEAKPVLKARLGCRFTTAGAAPRLSLGLAALAALLAAVRLEPC